jgi:hypothetical protein
MVRAGGDPRPFSFWQYAISRYQARLMTRISSKQDHRAKRGRDDGAQDAAAQRDTGRGQKPSGDEGADDADDDIAQKAKAIALDDLTGEPARDCADDKCDEKCFNGHDGPLCSRFCGVRCRPTRGNPPGSLGGSICRAAPGGRGPVAGSRQGRVDCAESNRNLRLNQLCLGRFGKACAFGLDAWPVAWRKVTEAAQR